MLATLTTTTLGKVLTTFLISMAPSSNSAAACLTALPWAWITR